MSESVTKAKKAGDRKFYSLPEEYENTSNVVVSDESKKLLENIYSNLSSRKAKFDGPYGKRPGTYKQIFFCVFLSFSRR